MKRVLTGTDAKIIDDISINEVKIPSVVLMERAALSVYNEIKGGYMNYLVIAGSGNNGADGIALARMLYLDGENVTVFLMSEKEGSEEYALQLSIAKNLGVEIVDYNDYTEGEIALEDYDCIVDAIFGIGLDRDITGKYKEIIEDINNTDSDVVAIDIPSGVGADNGVVYGCAVKSDVTITFGDIKVGHITYPGKEYIGHLLSKNIGFAPVGYEHINSEIYALDYEDLKLIPDRFDRSNKGSYGKLLIIAGSNDMSGAAYLSGLSAYRMGVGLVNIMTREQVVERIAQKIPEAIFTVINSDDCLNSEKIETDENIESDANKIERAIEEYDNIVIGPGLGKSILAKGLLKKVLARKCKTVIDADALNIIADDKELLSDLHDKCIITPHMAEMSRLTKKDIKEIIDNPFDEAVKMANTWGITCVLKDANTIIANPDGRVFINLSGNNGMSTAGSGDVLSGIIGGLIALGTNFDYAASLGVFIHGLCGDLAAEHNSKSSMMASDMIEEIKNIV